ncbi:MULTISPECIES: hypothetical protein [unclassified Lactonifactor]|uniref:hypothetical protein n=1 Tax=unclassified Lactonifactor TaxID=2636670 RepID=UPI001FA9D9EB|nr:MULTISPECIES: hypothetical protein [unclassified Lactonifactor]
MDIEWDKIADLVNKEFREEDVEYKEAAYRKPYAGAKRYFEAGVFNNLTEDKYLKELQIQKQELAKEQVKTRDERNELRRIIREEARKESYRDQILRSISEYQCSPLLYDESKQFTGVLKTDNDLLISCFDVHAGISTKNFWNKFDEDVLKRRFNEYLDKIFEIQLRHGSENAFLVLSELVSGFIHPTLRIENNQDMIEQFLCVTNYISEFLSELSYHFNNVHVFIAPGNHGRLSPKKEDNISNENMDNLVLPFLEAKLQNFKNIICHKNKIEQSIAMFNIRNLTVFSSHGDKESMEKAIPNLTLFTGIRPNIYLCGHRHTNAMMTVYDSKVLQAGCLSGSDAYCMDNRLRNRPEQLVAVITEKGLDCLYDVKFQ